jgi:hypothetical protein
MDALGKANRYSYDHLGHLVAMSDARDRGGGAPSRPMGICADL